MSVVTPSPVLSPVTCWSLGHEHHLHHHQQQPHTGSWLCLILVMSGHWWFVFTLDGLWCDLNRPWRWQIITIIKPRSGWWMKQKRLHRFVPDDQSLVSGNNWWTLPVITTPGQLWLGRDQWHLPDTETGSGQDAHTQIWRHRATTTTSHPISANYPQQRSLTPQQASDLD